MSRIASRYFAAATVMLLLSVTGSLLGQSPTPTPGPTAGPGRWSSEHPLWFDLNGDGSPQSSELTGYPRYDGEVCTTILGYPTVIGSSQSPCMEVYEDDGIGGSIQRPNGMTQQLFSNADGTVFTFTQDFGEARARARGVSALAQSAAGTGQLLETNGDGIYDTLQVVGTGPSEGLVPETRMSLIPRDVTGDGRPDYITVPWTITAGAGSAADLGVDVVSTPQIFFPLADTNEDGWPDTITVRVANQGLETSTGPPLAGPALANGAMIPSASTFGLFVFAAAVVALGVKLLRGSIVAS